MKKKCKNCGMLRAKKDVVLLKDNTILCFSCWNKFIRQNSSKK